MSATIRALQAKKADALKKANILAALPEQTPEQAAEVTALTDQITAINSQI